jgi:uncharacterized membrane protein YbhN (UPF0104 family)
MSTPKINKLLNLALRLAIIIISYLFMYYQFRTKSGLAETWEAISEGITLSFLLKIMVPVLLLMLLNWSIEALKWRYLIVKTERISFLTAFRAVWAGVTVSTYTPNRTGEYLGRVFVLQQTNPWKGAFMTVVGSFSQLLVTVLAGSLCFIVFAYNYFPWSDYIPFGLFVLLACMLLIADVCLILLYFNVKLFEPVLRKFTLKRWIKLREHLKVFAAYSAKELAVVLALSFARYTVFVIQFYLLLKLFSVPVSLAEGAMIIACIYFLMAAVPTVAFSEPGIRGTLAWFFFDLFYAGNYLIGDTAAVGSVSAASVIWLVNLVIPALAGGIFVLQLKFFRK